MKNILIILVTVFSIILSMLIGLFIFNNIIIAVIFSTAILFSCLYLATEMIKAEVTKNKIQSFKEDIDPWCFNGPFGKIDFKK